MTSSSNNELRVRIEEPSSSQESDSLAKLDDDEKLSTTGVKPVGGARTKKRRLVGPSSPQPEYQYSLLHEVLI
ncbi:conserved hypothetical protein [Ricinus communis]|uniref:Uncharacterized protein n=1 Tax=Ricinus communis TaxID=3988 RepID=B9SZC9_RICCO|nr:conserved hypothetical protein [Ricinus communis]